MVTCDSHPKQSTMAKCDGRSAESVINALLKPKRNLYPPLSWIGLYVLAMHFPVSRHEQHTPTFFTAFFIPLRPAPIHHNLPLRPFKHKPPTHRTKPPNSSHPSPAESAH